MRYIKTILCISIQNFRKWKTDYRIWILAILVMILTHNSISELKLVANAQQLPMTIWTYPFLYAQFYMKVIYTLPLLFLFCDAPFVDANQLFIISRSGRMKWCCGQLLYITMVSAVYYLFLIVCTVIFALPHISLSLEWDSLVYTLSRSGAAYEQDIWTFLVSWNVLNYFTPIQAMWFTFLVSWLSGTLLGMIIFACNILQPKKSVGGIIGASLIILSVFLANDYWTGTRYFSPFSWNTLDQIDIAGMTNYPPFAYCMTFYLVGIAVLSAVILLKNQKLEIVQNGDA